MIEQSIGRNINSIALSGGGAMGTTYPGIYQALVCTGIFKRLKNVAGSSAGSIISAMLCVGIPPLQFRKTLMECGIDTLLGEHVGTWPFFKYFTPRSGTPIFEFVRNQMNETVKQFLESNPDASPRLETALRDQNYELTFKDLAELHELFPERFKKITITATRQDTGELEYFSYETTPNIGIAKVCQASCAIPGILEKVTIENKSYFDGALRNNLPVDTFEKEKTLGVAFGEGLDNARNSVFQALYASRANEMINQPPPKMYFPNLSEWLFRDWFTPMYLPNHGGTNCASKQKLMEKIFSHYALRCMEIRVGSVNALNFAKANQHYRVLNAIGFLDALNYITNHELDDPNDLDQDSFYCQFVYNFSVIYKASLVATGKSYKHDPLFNKILATQDLSIREQYYSIRESLEIKLSFPWYLFFSNIDYAFDSLQAFALTRAFEYTNEILTDDDLFREICSKSKNTSKCVFFSYNLGADKQSAILNALQEIPQFLRNGDGDDVDCPLLCAK